MGETYRTHNFPLSVYSFGGKMELRKSSAVFWVGYALILGKLAYPSLPAFLPTDVETKIGVLYLTSDSSSLVSLDILNFII